MPIIATILPKECTVAVCNLHRSCMHASLHNNTLAHGIVTNELWTTMCHAHILT